MKNKLISKFSTNGPRYTSYPPVPFWNKEVTDQSWKDELKTSSYLGTGIDLYIHIPYCEELCAYCGCNRTITKNKDKGAFYVELLLKEWSSYKKLVPHIKINSIHLGGGTPTFLRPKEMEYMLHEILNGTQTDRFVGSVEVDPRTCQEEHLKVLRNFSFSRVSMGIQDFDKGVQKNIKRDQSFELVKKLCNLVRNYNFESICFDLIYGLPGQSLETQRETLEKVKELSPSFIAYYSYAHLPDKIKNQRLIDESLLPGDELKLDLFNLGRTFFIDQGLIPIGLDHFAKPDSYIGKAYHSKTLQRNFMGYTNKKSPYLIGLGSSSISESPSFFKQNETSIDHYQMNVERNILATQKGHHKTKKDQFIADLIQELMCHSTIDKNKLMILQNQFHHHFNAEEFKEYDILEESEREFIVTSSGYPYIRSIAMALDPMLLKRPSQHFSKTI